MLLLIISIIIVAIIASVIAAIVTFKVCADRFNVIARPEVVTPSDEVVVPSVGKDAEPDYLVWLNNQLAAMNAETAPEMVVVDESGKVETVTLETKEDEPVETKVAEVVPMSPKTKRTSKATKSETKGNKEVSSPTKPNQVADNGVYTKDEIKKAAKHAYHSAFIAAQKAGKSDAERNELAKAAAGAIREKMRTATKKDENIFSAKSQNVTKTNIVNDTKVKEDPQPVETKKPEVTADKKQTENPKDKKASNKDTKKVETITEKENKRNEGMVKATAVRIANQIAACKGPKELQTIVAKVATYKLAADIMSHEIYVNAYEAKTATFKPAEKKADKPNQADSKNNRRMAALKADNDKAKAKKNEPKSVAELNAKEEADKEAAKVASAIEKIEACVTLEDYHKVVNSLTQRIYENAEVTKVRENWTAAMMAKMNAEQAKSATKDNNKNSKPVATPVNSEDATYANNVKSTFVTKVYAMMVKNANCQKVTLKKSEVEYSKNGKNLKVESIARIPENDTDLVITFNDGEKSKGWNVTALNGTSKELKYILDKVSAAVKKEFAA